MKSVFVVLLLGLALITGCTTTGTQKKSGDESVHRKPFHHMGRLGL